jgi:Chromo (CHRromatin Organisation MOdifier) domain
VFHDSQLKKKVGPGTSLLTKLPLIGLEGTTLLNHIAILDRRAVKKNNAVAVEILVEWANLPVEEATWEDYHFIQE